MDDIKLTAADAELWPIEKLAGYKNNPYTHPGWQIRQIASSIRAVGFVKPIVVNAEGTILAGHGGLLAARELGLPQVPVVKVDYLTPELERAYRIADNRIAANAVMDMSAMDEEIKALNLAGMDMSLLGFSDGELSSFLDPADEPSHRKGSLRERFGVPPFSVLNARDGWWQDRKKEWIRLGIQSEHGRGANLLNFSDAAQLQKRDGATTAFGSAIGVNPELIPGYYDKIDRGMSREQIIEEYIAGGGTTASGTSIFDPVLCELLYRWFCPPGGQVLDPFAGGSVRGIVASKLGRWYQGIELRPEQVESNREQGEMICKEAAPLWHEGDGVDAPTLCKGVEFDMVFSCPPYVDLEVYSDDPRDLSNKKSFPEFLEAYRAIIAGACGMLKDDRFACFVVGEVRDKKTGAYYNFVGETVRAFQEAGLEFYGEAILVTAIGTLALRTPIHFESTRKLGKTHQNILIFLKGDGKKATKAVGKVEFGDIEADEEIKGEQTEHGEKLSLETVSG